VVVQIPQPNEEMCVKAFIRGLRSGRFGESLVHRRPKDMTPINLRVASYVKVEEFMTGKKEGGQSKGEKTVVGVRSSQNREAR